MTEAGLGGEEHTASTSFLVDPGLWRRSDTSEDILGMAVKDVGWQSFDQAED